MSDEASLLLGSSFDRLIYSRVGVYGLEILGRQNRDRKEIERDTE